METIPFEVWNLILNNIDFPARKLTKLCTVSKYFNLVYKKTRQNRQNGSELVAPVWLHDIRQNDQLNSEFSIEWLLDEQITKNKYYRDTTSYEQFDEEPKDFGIDSSTFLLVGVGPEIKETFALFSSVIKLWIRKDNPVELYLGLGNNRDNSLPVLFTPIGSTYESIVEVLRKYTVQLRTDPDVLKLDVLQKFTLSNFRLKVTPASLYPNEYPNSIKLFIGLQPEEYFEHMTTTRISNTTYIIPLVKYLLPQWEHKDPVIVKKRTMFSHSLLTFYYFKKIGVVFADENVELSPTFVEINYPDGYVTPNHERICQTLKVQLPNNLPTDVISALCCCACIRTAEKLAELAEREGEREVAVFVWFSAAIIHPSKRRQILERLANGDDENWVLDIVYKAMKYCDFFKNTVLPAEFGDPETTDNTKFRTWLLEQLRRTDNELDANDPIIQEEYSLYIDRPYPFNKNYNEKLFHQIRKQHYTTTGVIDVPTETNKNNNNNKTNETEQSNDEKPKPKKRAREPKQQNSKPKPAPKKAKLNNNNNNNTKNNDNNSDGVQKEETQPRRSARIKSRNVKNE